MRRHTKKLSLWYFTAADGSCVVRCYDYPGWRFRRPTVTQAREECEQSLRAYLAEHAEFHHFQPRAMREAA